MSRYYNIVIGAETAQQPNNNSASNNAGATFTNQVNGKAVTSAQQVEFDLSVTTLAGYAGVPGAGSKLTIRGVSIKQISQASDFSGAPITISAGMQNGLPLATAQAPQHGVIVQGTILSAYGNWIGVEQSLEFIIMPPTWPIQGGPFATVIPGKSVSQAQSPAVGPANIAFNWPKGTNMADMIKTVLKTALPNYTLNINISSSLVFTQDEPGFYRTVEQFAQWVNQMSLAILGSNPSYTGVQFSIQPNSVLNIFDNFGLTSANSTPKMLNAQDFIGQPTWLHPNTIQFNTVMRADLVNGTYFTFPKPLNLQTITTPQSNAFARQSSIFQGTWQIFGTIRHLGNSRGPNATDWISTFQAVNFSTTASGTNVKVNAPTQLSIGNTSA